jgi:hypothetical protein
MSNARNPKDCEVVVCRHSANDSLAFYTFRCSVNGQNVLAENDDLILLSTTVVWLFTLFGVV